MTWQPWHGPMPEVPRLAIDAPPCPFCKHWRPEPKLDHTETGQRWVGVVLCHAEDMWQDFSCFKENKT